MKIDLREVPVYWLTVDKYPDRQLEMEEMLSKLEFKNVTKIVGKRTDHYIEGIADTYLECLEKEPPFIIFEDDARLACEWDPVIETHDCDSIYLGVSRWGCNESSKRGVKNSTSLENYNDQYKRTLNMLSAHAILYLDKSYVKCIKDKIIEYKKQSIPYDCALALCQKTNNVLAFNKPVFYQRDKASCTKFILDEFTHLVEPVLTRNRMHNNSILHICNVWTRGGVPLFILDFVRAFKEFRHIVVCKNSSNIDEGIRSELLHAGAEFYFITDDDSHTYFRKVVESTDPFVTILHNTEENIWEANPMWTNYYPQVIWNHGIYSDLYRFDDKTFFFSSDWLKDFAISKGLKSKDITVCHPSINYEWYSSIERSPDEKIRFGTPIAWTEKFNKEAYPMIEAWIEENNTVASFHPLEKLTNNLRSYYESIDCLIYLQNSVESCSRMILEAFAAGVSVIAMKNSGPEELITKAGKKSGILIETIEELPQAMNVVVENRFSFIPNILGKNYCKAHGSYESLREIALPVLLKKGFSTV